MLKDLSVVEKECLLDEVAKLKWSGYRFAALTCEKEGDNHELIYHFDLDYSLKNIKVIINPKEPLKSISSFYPSAFLIENEYQDLYGFIFEGLTIDYKGRLYLTSDGVKTPLIEENQA